MCHRQRVMPIAVPPIQLDDVAESQVRDQIEHVIRNHCDGRLASSVGLLGDGTQRRTVQVVKVGVGHQHNVNGRQIAKLHTRLPQSLQNEEPARKIWIDNHVLPTDLDKKAGVSNESEAHLSIAYQRWLVGFAGPGNDCRMAHQAAEGAGTFPKSRVLETRL